jgi:UDP-glucose 4-epimerase
MKTSKKLAIVTGGAGFIGSHMVDLLIKKGLAVRVIDNMIGGHEKNLAKHASDKNVTIERKDIRELDPTGTLFKDAEFVFHFAGIGDIVPSIEHPIDYMDVNVQGTVRVLECAKAANVKKFVYAASSSCYGLADVPTEENHPIQPQYPYALSKYQGEQAVFHWNKVYGLPVNTLRIFNAYGTRVRTTGAYGAVFGVFFKQKLEGKPFTVVGDGSQGRDFIYVTDVASAFYAAAMTDKSGEIFNVGASNPQSVNKLVELLGGEIVYVPKRPGEPDCTWADITKIKTELGWKPEVSFEEGLEKMISEIEHWQEAPLWEPKSIREATKNWFKYMDK